MSSAEQTRMELEKIKSERKFTRELIELYGSFPCLWDTTSEEYKNVNTKKKAWEMLLQKYREIQTNANELNVKRKIESLKCCYQREAKKVKASMNRAGTSAGDIHKPNLWYYEHLAFLDKKAEASQSGLDTQMTSQDEEDLPSERARKKKWSETQTGRGQKSQENILEQKKIKLLDSAQDLFKQTQKEVNPFGLYISEKLDQIHGNQRDIAEKLIAEVVFLAKTNKLSVETKIFSQHNSRTADARFHQQSTTPFPYHLLPIPPQPPTPSHNSCPCLTRRRHSPTVTSPPTPNPPSSNVRTDGTDAQVDNSLPSSSREVENPYVEGPGDELLREMLIYKN